MSKFSDDEGKEELLELAVKAAKAGAWAWDLSAETRDLVRTEEYNKIMGITSSVPWTQEDWFNIIHPEEREAVRHQMESVASGQKNEYNAEYRVIWPDGSIHWVHSWGKGVRDSLGAITRITGITRDVTIQKRIEQDRDQFVATLSHDLRNPLTAAEMNAELIKKHLGQSEHTSELVEKVISNLRRINEMIEDVLDSSRIQAGHNLSLSLEKCQLTAVLREEIDELIDLHGDRIKFTSSGEFDGAWNKEGVRRILENLVENAIKYGSQNTLVTISLDQFNNDVVLTVHNEGNPIPKDEQKLIFEPFRRSKFSVEGIRKGWGLGLTIVKGLVKAHGGRIEVESGPRIGTNFVVRLPLTGQDRVSRS